MIGKILTEKGLVHSEETCKIAHLIIKAGDEIKAHNHPSECPCFVPVKGAIEISLELDGEKESHLMTPGKVLRFDGKAYISGLAKEDSEAFVFLIKKVEYK